MMMFAMLFLLASCWNAYQGEWNAAIWMALVCSIWISVSTNLKMPKKDTGNDHHP